VTFKLVLPILLLILTVCNLFNLYDRILQALGVSRFQFHHEYTDENIEEGKRLVQQGNYSPYTVARGRLENETSTSSNQAVTY
jgi:hypothetical protein